MGTDNNFYADPSPALCRQCAPVTFYITPQAVDTGKITSAFIEKAVLDVLAPIIGVVGAILAPFTGGASVAASVGASLSQ